MGKARNWTADEQSYLQESWGTVSINTIAKNLGRSQTAIKIKANKLGLGPFLDSGDYITVNQLSKAFKGGTNFYTYQLKSWVENRGFPVKYKRVSKSLFRIIYLDDFWKWAEKNRSFLDFSKLEPLAFGWEPEWVQEQRKKDFQSFSIQRKDRWTSADDDRLRILLQKHCYSYTEISELLHRSEGAIQRRCMVLGLKERPVKAEPAEWTPEHYSILADGICSGDNYRLLSKKIYKSEKAIRGKVYSTYSTENLDKVRQMLLKNDGKWEMQHGNETDSV